MARVESKLANGFLKQLANVNGGTARTVSIHLADFEQFVKREYHKDLDSLVEELKSYRLGIPLCVSRHYNLVVLSYKLVQLKLFVF